VIAGVVLFLLGALLVWEAAARVLAGFVDEPLWWHDLFTQRKERQLRALSREGGVDVVVLGTSLVLLGLDPQPIENELGRKTYNASIYRGLPRLSEAWLTDRVLKLLRPRVVVLGLCPAELNDNSPLCGQLALYQGSRALRHRTAWWFARKSYALRYSYLLRKPRTLGRAVGAALRDPRDWRWSLPEDIPGKLGARGEGLDFLDRSYFTGPRMRELCRQQAHGAEDRGEQSAAMRRILELNARHGARTVFVGMPVAKEYIETLYEGGRAAWDESWQRMRDVVEALGTTLIDFHEGFETEEYYADMLHMNRRGRDEYSAAVAKALRGVLDEEGAA